MLKGEETNTPFQLEESPFSTILFYFSDLSEAFKIDLNIALEVIIFIFYLYSIYYFSLSDLASCSYEINSFPSEPYMPAVNVIVAYIPCQLVESPKAPVPAVELPLASMPAVIPVVEPSLPAASAFY